MISSISIGGFMIGLLNVIVKFPVRERLYTSAIRGLTSPYYYVYFNSSMDSSHAFSTEMVDETLKATWVVAVKPVKKSYSTTV